MVNVTINGKQITVKEGTTILEAANINGILIPTLCFLKDINEIGATYASYYGYTDYQEILDTYGNEMNAELGYEKLSEKVQSFLNDNSVEQ